MKYKTKQQNFLMFELVFYVLFFVLLINGFEGIGHLLMFGFLLNIMKNNNKIIEEIKRFKQ